MNVFGGGILESACLSVCPSVQNTTFCQSAGGGIKLHSVTALVFNPEGFLLLPNIFLPFRVSPPVLKTTCIKQSIAVKETTILI